MRRKLNDKRKLKRMKRKEKIIENEKYKLITRKRMKRNEKMEEN